LAPALWRNVCPLATLGTGSAPATPLTTSEWRARLMATSALPVGGPPAPASTPGTRALPTVHASPGQRAQRAVIARANVTGIVFLLTLLPARRLLLNESALATLALVAGAGLAAWILGR